MSRLKDELRQCVRQLRRDTTNAEELLWFLLRDRRLVEAKFRRQHPVSPYVLDFYCPQWKLAVEVDGSQHLAPDQEKKDQRRTAFLEKKGIHVVRFWNNDVMLQTESVLETIWQAIEARRLFCEQNGLE